MYYSKSAITHLLSRPIKAIQYGIHLMTARWCAPVMNMYLWHSLSTEHSACRDDATSICMSLPRSMARWVYLMQFHNWFPTSTLHSHVHAWNFWQNLPLYFCDNHSISHYYRLLSRCNTDTIYTTKYPPPLEFTATHARASEHSVNACLRRNLVSKYGLMLDDLADVDMHYARLWYMFDIKHLSSRPILAGKWLLLRSDLARCSQE